MKNSTQILQSDLEKQMWRQEFSALVDKGIISRM